MKYLFDAYGNPISFHYNDETDEVTLHHKQDVTSIIENNKSLRNENDGYSPSRELKRVASIPVGLVQQWLTVDGIDPQKFWTWKRGEQNAYLRRKIQDRDWSQVRTA
jgi:hypothetical protein